MKRLSQKIILVSVVLSSLLFLSVMLTIFSTNSMKKVAIDIFSDQGYVVVEKAQNYIDGDLFEKFTTNMKEPNDFFFETQKKLFNLKFNNECAYLYTMIPGKGTDFYYVIDASDDPSISESENEPIGSVFDATEDFEVLQKVLAEKTICQTEMYFSEEWGWIVTFYGPILNSANKTVGIVAADYLVADFLKDIKVVHKNVTSLSEASDEILKNTHTMIFHLDEIKESAEGASESATINLGLTENLNSLVLGYKTE